MKKNKIEKKEPVFISPMLATLTYDYFSDNDWIYEPKLDGIRCIVVKKDRKVTLYSRNRNNLNKRFSSLLPLFQKQKSNFILDGEIVAFDKKVTSFSKLQQSEKSKTPIYFYAFDLLYFDKYDLRKIDLLERKRILKTNFEFSSHFRYTPHKTKEGEKYFSLACKKGWEGVMAKKADSKYLSKRSRDWLKFKCGNRQEFIIGGYTDPEGSRVGFGALLIGFRKNGKLKYAGKVGTGYDREFLKKLSSRLKKIERSSSPFSDEKTQKLKAHWVRPSIVCEISFTEWTEDGKLRHPSFLGLRFDKPAKLVIKETAQARKK